MDIEIMIETFTKVTANKWENNIVCKMADINQLNNIIQTDYPILVVDLLKKLIDLIILFLGFNLYYVI
jgi:hypothetical protein